MDFSPLVVYELVAKSKGNVKSRQSNLGDKRKKRLLSKLKSMQVEVRTLPTLRGKECHAQQKRGAKNICLPQ